MASMLPAHGGRISTDTEHEAIGSLEALADFLEDVETDPDHWKWAIIALHNAVQGFMVLALNGSQSWGALRDEDIALKCKAEVDFWKAKAAGDDVAAEAANNIMLWNPPKKPAKLAQFLDLYKRIKRQEWPMDQGMSSKVYPKRKTDDRCMQDLNRVRNEYAHFIPGGRNYLLSQFPAMTATGLHIISYLVNDSGNIYFHRVRKGNASEVRFDKAMTQAKEALARISAEYSRYPVIINPACGSTPVPPP
jgi:hypothetical protein